MFHNKLNAIIIILLFISCESITYDKNSLELDDLDINSFSIIYEHENNIISIFLELSNYVDVQNINVLVTTNGNIYEGDIIFSDYLNISNFNSSIYTYEGFIELSDDTYIYDIALVFEFEDQENMYFLDTFTTPIRPNIDEVILPNIFELDSTLWSTLPIELVVSNMNGLNNIESVSYQVKRFYDGCQIDCMINENCNNPINDDEYISDSTWILEHLYSNNNDQIHNFIVDIPMRPIDGSALIDENNNEIFAATDCGRVGLVLLKFIVVDKDGLINEVYDIPIEIIAP
tara:strand:- start:1393 stop:2256 length:864 start_codon:yes stop_codon:yes gene_type:complete